MIKVPPGRVLFAVAALAILPAPALAKDDLADRANALAEQANDVQARAGALANEARDAQAERDGTVRDDDAVAGTRDRDDHDFPWGILGLLGLAGLFGLQRPGRRIDPVTRDPRP
jgi:MYXO-CTERM domain-containing protein